MLMGSWGSSSWRSVLGAVGVCPAVHALTTNRDTECQAWVLPCFGFLTSVLTLYLQTQITCVHSRYTVNPSVRPAGQYCFLFCSTYNGEIKKIKLM